LGYPSLVLRRPRVATVSNFEHALSGSGHRPTLSADRYSQAGSEFDHSLGLDGARLVPNENWLPVSSCEPPTRSLLQPSTDLIDREFEAVPAGQRYGSLRNEAGSQPI